MEEKVYVLGNGWGSGKLSKGLIRKVQVSEVFFIFIFLSCGFTIFPLPSTCTKEVNINNYHVNVNRSSSWENIVEMLHRNTSTRPH